jgi:alpha-2-macroglobulin-like protein
MIRKTILISLVILITAFATIHFNTQAANSSNPKQIGSDISLLQVTSDSIEVEFIKPPGGSGLLEAELLNIKGDMLAKVTRRHSGKPITVTLYAQLDKNDLSNYYVRYRYDSNQEYIKRSLLFVGEVLETTILGQREFIAGTAPLIRIIIKDRASGGFIENANVSVELTQDGNVLFKSSGKSNAEGEVAARIAMPEMVIKNAKLKVVVKTSTAEDTVEEIIQVRSALRTLLTTDKPLYQPGQTIHIRALSLSQPDMEPLSDSDVVFEVEDAKGIKVFKKSAKTDEYGISFVDFVLADELNMGTYKIRSIAAGMTEEKTVTVERYVLPKFKVNFKSDFNFYQPGQTVKGDIQVDYFFGKPVSAGKVQVKCSKFDVAYVDFQTIDSKTDENGHYSFDVRLPDNFVGQPLEAGKASAKFEISVIDTADHKETITKNISVTASPIVIAAVAESGELIPGIENTIYFVSTYADSIPAKCTIIWSNAPGGSKTIETDNSGFAEVSVDAKNESMTMLLSAKDAKGQTGNAKIEIKNRERNDEDTILVRTNESLYRVGDKASISIVSTRKTGTVYIDLIKDRQTYLTRTVELKNGKASDSVTLNETLAGTVQVNAYIIGRNGVIVRDRRIVLIDPANDLSIEVAGDSDTYLPGSEAKINFKVTNKSGKGVASALGVMVVDEAVFALQEMQPGLEKVYFYLEKEIATPRYEIHGYEIDNILTPQPLLRERDNQARQEKAARVLFASAKGTGDYSLNVNTYQQNNKDTQYQNKMASLLMLQYQKIQSALNSFANRHRRNERSRVQAGPSLAVLVQEKDLEKKDTIDPWGIEFRITGEWNVNAQQYSPLIIISAGIDGKWDTIDDVSIPYSLDMWSFRDGKFKLDVTRKFQAGRGGGMGGRFDREEMFAEDAVMFNMAAPAQELNAFQKKSDESSFTGQNPIRIRQYFPETLYFNPAVITDGSGKAVLNISIADSITTWRLTCMASSLSGQLGSTTAGINVFQDFFVDIDFPVSLTQNDEVSVPVAIYNYLKTDQTINLTVQKEDWFELKDLGERTVTLAPSEVRAVYFTIVAKKIGFQKFTVTARGTKKSDAVARSVEIVPDGKEFIVNASGRLKANISHTITIPDKAIDDASKIFVKVYPGVLSQVIEGLDSMLRMPGGCFEQTSSMTYPNVLVMDYMKSTGKITPEIQMKAEGFINAGYQRLVSFEVPGGGFEWFGKAPAHRILTAYGLMEFYDMSKVYEVDPAVISRTQQWLARQQEKDGSYKPAQGGIQEGAINKFTDDVLRNTAYITWALASTDYKGPEVQKGINYIKNHLDDMKDVYARVLVVNALAAVDAEDKTTLDTLQTLYDMRKEKDDITWWELNSETPTHGTGDAGNIEVTALAVQGFIKCGRELGTVSKAVTYLVQKKDSFGTWQSTQATIQALRAMLMAERGATARTNAEIAVRINNEKVTTIVVNQDNSDVMQLVDLNEYTKKGNNNIELSFEGEGSLLYQVVGRYYMPYPKEIEKPEEPMKIELKYDRTQLAADDIINVTAVVTNNRPGKAKMVIVDLGLPPGFTLIPENLNKLTEQGVIEKYSTTGRQIIIYLREVDSAKPVKIDYQLLAKYPLKAKTPKSVVYEYYNPDIRVENAPIEIEVTK